MPYLRASLDHIALDCKRDPLAMVAFYNSVLGFEPCHIEEYKSNKVPFPSVRVSPTTVIDFFPPPKEAPQVDSGLRYNNHFCLAVSEKEYFTLKSALEEKGMEVKCAGEKRWGALGDADSFYVNDPDRNVIEFRYYEKASMMMC